MKFREFLTKSKEWYDFDHSSEGGELKLHKTVHSDWIPKQASLDTMYYNSQICKQQKKTQQDTTMSRTTDDVDHFFQIQRDELFQIHEHKIAFLHGMMPFPSFQDFNHQNTAQITVITQLGLFQ
jgi:hypothetical protein